MHAKCNKIVCECWMLLLLCMRMTLFSHTDGKNQKFQLSTTHRNTDLNATIIITIQLTNKVGTQIKCSNVILLRFKSSICECFSLMLCKRYWWTHIPFMFIRLGFWYFILFLALETKPNQTKPMTLITLDITWQHSTTHRHTHTHSHSNAEQCGVRFIKE